jgi:uncharacterized UPF0160 family protein
VGVNIGASAMASQGVIVRNCDFLGLDSDIDTDIQIASGGHILIENNRFDHDQPAYATGAYKYYIKVVTVSTGGVYNNFFGTETQETATACSLSNMDAAGNWCSHSNSTMIT